MFIQSRMVIHTSQTSGLPPGNRTLSSFGHVGSFKVILIDVNKQTTTGCCRNA